MNEIQKQIVEAVRARGYLNGWTPAQLGARQVVKLVEEITEIGECVRWGLGAPGWLGEELAGSIAARARNVFNAGYCGRVDRARDAVEEVADCYVVLSVLTYALEQMLGREIDLEAEALAKATGDVARGVRG